MKIDKYVLNDFACLSTHADFIGMKVIVVASVQHKTEESIADILKDEYNRLPEDHNCAIAVKSTELFEVFTDLDLSPSTFFKSQGYHYDMPSYYPKFWIDNLDEAERAGSKSVLFSVSVYHVIR